jgi:phage pi2 protein 07
MDNDTVTIPKAEYDRLLLDRESLQELRAAGADNWEGYDDAMRAFREGQAGRIEDE